MGMLHLGPASQRVVGRTRDIMLMCRVAGRRDPVAALSTACAPLAIAACSPFPLALQLFFAD